jgi:hypothetical protein
MQMVTGQRKIDRRIGEFAATIMNDFWKADLVSGSTENGMSPFRPPVVLIAEGRMAVEFLERAADWASDVDRESVADMAVIQRRLLEKIQHLVQPPRPGLPDPVGP